MEKHVEEQEREREQAETPESQKEMQNRQNQQNRIAIIGIIVNDMEASEKINEILHRYSQYVVGRMGIPYRERGVSVISVVVDAPGDTIGALSGKLGMIPGITTKTIYSKM